MQIEIISPEQRPSTECVIIIDIFTFSTTLTLLGSKNAKEIFCMGGEFEDSIKVQSKMKGSILIDDAVEAPDESTKRINGNTMPLQYADQIFGKKFENTTFIYRSKNGSQVLNSFIDVRYVFVGGLVNLAAIKRVLSSLKIEAVSLVPCGAQGSPNADDSISAEYMKFYLENGQHDYEKYKNMMRSIVDAKGVNDFFEKYFCTPYGKMLGLNLSLDLYENVFQAKRDIQHGDLKLISLINHV